MYFSKQRKWSADPKWTKIFVHFLFFTEKILQKNPRFSNGSIIERNAEKIISVATAMFFTPF